MMDYAPQDTNMAAEQRAFSSDGVKAENDFDGFEWSEEQVNLLLERMSGGGGGNVLAGGFYQQQEMPPPAIYKMEDVKAETLALSPPHLVRYRVHDGKHVKTWQCAICSKEFTHQYTLMRHIPTHTDERKYTCRVCGKAFRQMSTLSQHRAIHSADRPYICELCDKTFNRVSTLISHRKTHTNEKPHQCHLCHKAFHQKGNLRNHIFTHTNERPYKCDLCNRGFNQMSNLMCHKLKAHQRSDRPRYTCQICGKDFQKRIGLRNHEQCQHGVHNNGAGVAMPETPRIRYTNGVLVERITTEAMQHAIALNQTPFALLRPLNGIPVLVRVLPAAEKQQMLVPATAEDLKKYADITILKTNGVEGENNGAIVEVGDVKLEEGSTVQIRVPVVATVVQRRSENGNMCMTIQAAGPCPTDDATILNNNITSLVSVGSEQNNVPDGNNNNQNSSSSNESLSTISETQIEFIDERGNVITEEEFQAESYFDQGLPITYENNVDADMEMMLPMSDENKENVNTLIKILDRKTTSSSDIVETFVEFNESGNAASITEKSV